MLRHVITFRTPLAPALARTSMVTWLISIGYRLNSAPFLSSVDLGRGSTMGNLGSLNPKMWNARLRAMFTPLEGECEVELELTVSTFGQVFTNSDVEYWTYELSETVSAACGGHPDPAEFVRRTRKAYWANGWRAGFFTLVILATLIVSAYLTAGSWLILPITTIAGTGCWYLFRAPKRIVVTAPKPFEPKPDGNAPPIALY